MLISNKRKNECIRYFISDLVKQDEIQMAVTSRWDIENFHDIKDVYLDVQIRKHLKNRTNE